MIARDKLEAFAAPAARGLEDASDAGGPVLEIPCVTGRASGPPTGAGARMLLSR